jgi:superfamily I DNA/RNA helicase
MQSKDYKRIGDHLGLKFTGREVSDGPSPVGRNPGDQYQFIAGFSRARCIDFNTVWDMINHDSLNKWECARYIDTVKEYKQSRNLYDFADMLEFESRSIDVDVLIIDEAQDLSTAQWNYVDKTFSTAKRVYIGGDDDQAIFEWSGADVARFNNIVAVRTVLDVSYRIPSDIHDIATGISAKIKNRTEKIYKSRLAKGTVDYWGAIDHIDMSSGTWLLLARNSYLLAELSAATKSKGFTYVSRGVNSVSATHVKAIRLWEQYRKGYELQTNERALIDDYVSDYDSLTIWHEAFDKLSVEVREYYISLLRSGESLTKQPRINISTIHGSKGGEADNVVLLTDMSYSTWDAINLNGDSEHRVWYVGATRAKEALHIIQPRGRYYYNI